jgi:hypothetical protein
MGDGDGRRKYTRRRKYEERKSVVTIKWNFAKSEFIQRK